MARILLAESDRKIREFIAGILADCGHDVHACENGTEASAWLLERPVDVLVSDLVLSGTQGSILGINCAALGIPMITLTGREFRAEEAKEDRPRTLLEKPFRFADLQRVLNAVGVHPRSTDAQLTEALSAV
jgi:DNA-binding NtrC family response regulator